MRRLRACDATIEHLRETDNPAVMWGDTGLIHAIADRLGWEHHAWKTEKRLLDALSKTPGDLVPGYTVVRIPGVGMRDVRIFRLPEKVPA